MAPREQAPGGPGDLVPVRVQEDDPQLVLAIGLGGGHEQPDDERHVRVPQRERAAADPRDPPAQDVELLPGLGLGRVGEEGVVDLGHGTIVEGGRCRLRP
jgi:hypothetical protein